MARTLQDTRNREISMTNSDPSTLVQIDSTICSSQSSSAHSQANQIQDLFAPNRYQPSKNFITRCCAELESLLESIRDKYHEEIKNLNAEVAHADFHVKIGDEFEKPLHKCILVARVFKLFNALKTFEVADLHPEKDIIVSEFQSKLTVDDANEDSNSEEANSIEEESIDISPVYCHLPEHIIEPELLLNLIRRVYLNQDVLEEESALNQHIVDWLKINKPSLIKSPTRHSPDHRESFRTVQPFFEELAPDVQQMSPKENSPIISGEINQGEVDGEVGIDYTKEENSPSLPSLTRAETFELISRENLESPQHENDATNQPPEEIDSESSSAEIPTPYAPTTRTGLKPKTFTTPKNLLNPREKTSKVQSTIKIDEGSGSKTKSTHKQTVTSSARQVTKAQSVNKRASLSNNHGEEVPLESSQPNKSSNPGQTKATPVASTLTKAKLTSIARAHPISLERSQSPSTNLVKSGAKNFIAANKRSIAQLEKKVLQPESDSTPEVDTTDVTVALESLTIDNLSSNLDRFTLVSQSKLAEALSRLFVDGIMTDVIIHTKDDKKIDAHRCILAARSAYLADMIEKASNPTDDPYADAKKQKLKLQLTDYSYPAVYFSILHIYSGIVKVPDDLDLEDLTKLTHQLHVTTLRQVCMHNLKMRYCHFFHKPCNTCCLGVLRTLPLAWRYDYTDLYSKCLQWIGSHFASIFCLKEFSELKPHDLVEECYSATLTQLSPDNIIPKTIECQKLLKNLPRVKWTESIICLVGRLLEDFCNYVAENYEKILTNESFLSLSKNCWECEVLEENLLAAMNHLRPDTGCRTLIQLHKIECSIESRCDNLHDVSDSFSNLITKMRKYCERYLLKEAASVVHCNSWRLMSPALQKRIRDQAILATDFDEPTKTLAAKPKLPSMSRVSGSPQQSSNPQSSQLQSENNSTGDGAKSPSIKSSVGSSRLRSPSTTYLPQPKSKTASARHVKVLK